MLIRYEATMVQAGGANDRVSDLNAFWMATDARTPGDLFAARRSGKFADYNQLRTYYVGQGGNGNTTTRFRRYIGDTELRPMLPGAGDQRQGRGPGAGVQGVEGQTTGAADGGREGRPGRDAVRLEAQTAVGC